jgi:hypothetical protein
MIRTTILSTFLSCALALIAVDNADAQPAQKPLDQQKTDQPAAQQDEQPKGQQGSVGIIAVPEDQRVNPVNEMSKQAEAGAEFDQDFAFKHLEDVCSIGRRISASPGMVQQQTYLREHFEAIGAIVKTQPFNARDPRTGAWVQLDNLIARFHPERERRLLFCCHYDTRPFPDQDKRDPMGLFIGANDGGSGVGLLSELGRHMQNMEGRYGVDIIFFDGEEFVFVAKRDPMFLGSNFFANEYAAGRYDVRYEYGILVDMIGDKKLNLRFEMNSLNFAERLTRSIWSVAHDLKVKEFSPKRGHTIRDDHLPLNMIAGIQTCDIIDFDYPTPRSKNAFWHTTKDTVENCSADSLGKVGKVLLEWTRRMQKLNGE